MEVYEHGSANDSVQEPAKNVVEGLAKDAALGEDTQSTAVREKVANALQSLAQRPLPNHASSRNGQEGRSAGGRSASLWRVVHHAPPTPPFALASHHGGNSLTLER